MEQMREIEVMRLSGREERHYLSQAMKERVSRFGWLGVLVCHGWAEMLLKSG